MDSRVTPLSPSTGRLLALGTPMAFVLVVAVAKLSDPWWQRLLGPLFAAMGFFPWVALRHAGRRLRAAWRPWISLAAGGVAFFLLRHFFAPILPPLPDPFIERIPVKHLDWHTLLFSWMPWPFFLHAFASFDRAFVAAVMHAPVRLAASVAALAGLCLAIPGVLLPARSLDFAIQFPLLLLAAAAIVLPSLAKSPSRA